MFAIAFKSGRNKLRPYISAVIPAHAGIHISLTRDDQNGFPLARE
jgi:hypothetical protein